MTLTDFSSAPMPDELSPLALNILQEPLSFDQVCSSMPLILFD